MGLISLADANIRQEKEFFLKGMTSHICTYFFSFNSGYPPSIPTKES